MIDLGPDAPLWLIASLAFAFVLWRLAAVAAKVIKEIMPGGSRDRKELWCKLLEHRRAVVAARREHRRARRQERNERRQARCVEREQKREKRQQLRKQREIEDATRV
ncbi:hypothetical protein [Streptosporangium sp. NPDC006930]|uniref:hypothetical protein n=1 Tax=Streptosporangium sp. NPDC006930 TaxID=3154783 RepID=UPI003447B9A3